MLIDEYLENTRALIASPHRAWAGETMATRDRHMLAERHTEAMLLKAQPFVLSPLTISTAADLAKYQRPKMQEHAQYMHLPAYETWIDLTSNRPDGAIPGGRTGVLIIGDAESKNVTRGEMLVTTSIRDLGWAQLAGRFDLAKSDLWSGAGDANQEAAYRARGGDPDQLIATVWAAIALINTPRLSILQPQDYSRLNKARQKRHLPPLLKYTLVRIAIDRGEVGPSHKTAETDSKALHHVRAFLRFKRGKVELVRPHWRGNPKFGVIKHRYIAFRAEDEKGDWKGPPPDAPIIMQQTGETSP